jgi:hypothetical protein
MIAYTLVNICIWCLLVYLFLLWYPFEGNESQNPFSLRILRWHNDIRGPNETAGSDTVVSWKPQDLIPQSHWNRGIWSRGLIETVESDPSVSMAPLDLLQWHLQIRWIFYKIFHVGSSSLVEIMESVLCKRVGSHIGNRFYPVNQGPIGGFFDEKKNEGRKSRDTVSLKSHIIHDFAQIM